MYLKSTINTEMLFYVCVGFGVFSFNASLLVDRCFSDFYELVMAIEKT